MRKVLLAALLLALSHPALAQAPYRILKTATVGGDGGFDYIVADSPGRRLYIARSGKTNPRLLAFDLDSLKQVGELDGISAHGAVVDPANHHGFASSKPITMFDSSNTTLLKSIAVDGNPDGLSLDAGAHRVYVLSHSAPNITAINTDRRRGAGHGQSGRRGGRERVRWQGPPLCRAGGQGCGWRGGHQNHDGDGALSARRTRWCQGRHAGGPGAGRQEPCAVRRLPQSRGHGDDECRYRRHPRQSSHRRAE